jgi:NADPH:quinone reductase-like Zn-dependent oxidoreductase
LFPFPSFRVIGATKGTPGTFARHVIIDRDQLVLTPGHLDDVHAAALPLGALTAWRACFVNGGVTAGSTVLITGIGGGVALLALQLCVAAGAQVWVTGGSPEKIKQAQSFGAKGGVLYKSSKHPFLSDPSY